MSNAQVETILISRSKLFREGLKSLLVGTSYEVTRLADDIDQIDDLADKDPDNTAILLDDGDGASRASEIVAEARGLNGDMPIIVLSDDMNPENLASYLKAGADAYLIKDLSFDALLRSLELVMLGEKVFPTQLAAYLVNHAIESSFHIHDENEPYGLSQREVQILKCLLRGDSNKMIARRLDITDATVKVHMKSLLRKIKAGNRTQAAIWALNHGISGDATLTNLE